MSEPDGDKYLQFSEHATYLMKYGKVLADGETPKDMLDRVAGFFAKIERKYFYDKNDSFTDELKTELYNRKIVPSTPILTNAGRFEKPLSACSVPPISLRASMDRIRFVVDAYHRDGMGTGFDLNEVVNPVEMLLYLNDIAISGLSDKEQLRPVGNMGTLSVSHPRISEFINSKCKYRDKPWAFNISVDANDKFMNAVINHSNYRLLNGKKIYADTILNELAQAAWDCADPGLLFLERLNNRSPLQRKINYVSAAPCAEMGLAKGETCQFAYINIAEFCNGNGLNYDELEHTVKLAVRMLDDATEYNANTYRFVASRIMTNYGRKIGIGICGFSDLLAKMSMPFASNGAESLAANILSFVNLKSKEASIELAKKRGVFEGFPDSMYIAGDFLSKKFGGYETNVVSSAEWERLDKTICDCGIRNSATIILPPTGRSALMFDTSQQMEPIFYLYAGARYNPYLVRHLEKYYDEQTVSKVLGEVKKSGSLQKCQDISSQTKDIFLTAAEIPYQDHLSMLRTIQKFTDEAVSKTINLPNEISVKEIKDIFISAYMQEMAGISIYRDGSRSDQPIKLACKHGA